MTVGMLAIEGKVLPLGILREGLAKVTLCPEGYALADAELDAMTLIVVAFACETGYVTVQGDYLVWAGNSAGQSAGTSAGKVSDENLN